MDTNYQSGLYEVGVIIRGKPKEIMINGVLTEVFHEEVELFDPMSEYVEFVDINTLKVEQAPNLTADWVPISVPYTKNYNEVTKEVYCKIPKPEKGIQYRISYQIKVKEEYKDVRIHEDQISGKLPIPEVPNNGGKGVVANGYTYAKSTLVNQTEILVPTVRLDSPTTISIKKKIESRGNLRVEEFYMILTGPNNYAGTNIIGSLEMINETESETFDFTPPTGGFRPGTYTLNEFFEANSRYVTASIAIYKEGVLVDTFENNPNASFSVDIGDKEIAIVVTNKPKKSTPQIQI
ncbi:MAG: hypothetical protein ACK5LC_00640 [Coprobacillaceae bacterium]